MESVDIIQSTALNGKSKSLPVGVLDLGTSSIKAAMLAPDGTLDGLFSAACPGPGPNSELFAFDPEVVCSEACRLLRAWRGAELGALVCTNQRATIVGVDAAGAALCCLAWADSRCQDLLEAAGGALARDRFRQLTGLPPTTLISIGKILWLKARHPGVFARVDKFVFLQDYVVHRLTGADYTCDHSNASASGFYNIRTKNWDTDLLAAAGLTTKRLPLIRPAGAACGPLLPAAAAMTGLAPGLPVILGGGDSQCSAYGLGGEDGVGVLTLGTSGSLSVVADPSVLERGGGALFLAHIDPSRIVVESFMNSFSSSLDWAGRLTGAEPAAADFSLDLDALNGEACYLPFIHGIGTPDYLPGAAGALVGLRAHSGPREITQAVIKGLVLETRRLVEECRRTAPLKRLVLAGGAAGNPAIVGLMAAALDVEVLVNDQKEASLFGAGLIALRALGTGEDMRRLIAGQLKPVAPGWVPAISRNTVAGWYQRYLRWVDAAKISSDMVTP